MSSTYGEHLKLSIFGQSHGAAIGMTLDGIPAGLPVDMEQLQHFLNRRAPGRQDFSTPRREADRPEFLSGVVGGYTCGAPIAAVIPNTNTHSGDYANLKDCPRPGHADYTAQVKYGGYQDAAGGGHFSGRLTAPMCIAGGLCLQWLAGKGIAIAAHLASVGNVADTPLDPMTPALSAIGTDFPVIDPAAGHAMRRAIADAKTHGDSLGGVIECAVTGLPAGLGEPIFGGMESRLAAILYGIPAVKGVEFGAGFAAAKMLGSQHNDPFAAENGRIYTLTNHAGGILGGITNGMPLLFRVAVKPTPSISLSQQSVSLTRLEPTALVVKGRHDPCIAPRAVPVVEAAAAIAIMDAYLAQTKF
ncbi:MAG TPA: chorismate synthase [Candidatus Faecousia intestinigallinarum]|nr:chorismate synthase [Candidatus Faecousia intestinigallinarum]